MKKFRIYLTLLVIMMFVIVLPVSASSSQPKIVDEESLLTTDEFNELNTTLEEASEQTGDDIVVVTVSSLNGKDATSYADDYYDENGYDENGIMLLISMSERAYAISTKGSCIDVFTTDVMDSMENDFVPDLSSGDYASAFNTFANESVSYINSGGAPKKHFFSFINVIIALVLGCIISFVMTGFKKAKLTSVKEQEYASNYVTDENITGSRDIYLYHTVSVSPKPKESDHDSGEHMSSSGDMHGGDSGFF